MFNPSKCRNARPENSNHIPGNVVTFDSTHNLQQVLHTMIRGLSVVLHARVDPQTTAKPSCHPHPRTRISTGSSSLKGNKECPYPCRHPSASVVTPPSTPSRARKSPPAMWNRDVAGRPDSTCPTRPPVGSPRKVQPIPPMSLVSVKTPAVDPPHLQELM